MLYCDECAKKHSWPVKPGAFYGECEVCGKDKHVTQAKLRDLQKTTRKAIEAIQVEELPKDFVEI